MEDIPPINSRLTPNQDYEDDIHLEMSKVHNENIFSDDDGDFDVLKNLESNMERERNTIVNRTMQHEQEQEKELEHQP